jgi:purine nucleosidase
MTRLLSLMVFAVAIPSAIHSADVRDVIIDEDGGVDDLVAISLLMRSAAVRVRAIVICPADSYLDAATRATQLFVDRLGGANITIAQGHNEGANPFPAQWRKDAGRVLGIPALANASKSSPNPVVPEPAAEHLVKLLSGNRSWTILETGPLTNIADALKLKPSIAKHIARIYVMGGAVRAHGNVEQPGHDGSAEWNIFNQPQAADEVVRSGIPITFIPLDATNKVPLTKRFIEQLAAQPSTASQLAAQAWHVAATQEGNDQYFFWDTLTAAALLDPTVVRTEKLKIRVITTGPSQGRTAEDPRGNSVEVALDASQARVEKMFLDILAR